MYTVFGHINLIRTVEFPHASSRPQLCSAPHHYTPRTPPALTQKHWRTSWALRPTLSSYIPSHVTPRGDVTTLWDEQTVGWGWLPATLYTNMSDWGKTRSCLCGLETAVRSVRLECRTEPQLRHCAAPWSHDNTASYDSRCPHTVTHYPLRALCSQPVMCTHTHTHTHTHCITLRAIHIHFSDKSPSSGDVSTEEYIALIDQFYIHTVKYMCEYV